MTIQIGARVCAVDATVTRRTALCREHVALEFVARGFPASVPGQFLQLRCSEAEPAAGAAVEWPDGRFPHLDEAIWAGTQPYLRRPFSIADRSDSGEQTTLAVISRAIGVGTRWLDRLQPGAKLNISGPLGHGFDVPAEGRPLVLIGGGVGIPPLLYLARWLHERGRSDVTLVVGATTRELLPVMLNASPDPAGAPRPCAALPGGAPYGVIVTTDDGTLGLRGYATTALDRWRPESGAGPPLVFACGPDAMLRAVARKTRALGWDCQLCVETIMGCGLGTCLSCVVRVRDTTRPAGWRWALSCSEGPVFERDALLDDDAHARP